MKFAILAITLLTAVASAQETPGAKLYADQCKRCHGDQGQGTKKHPQALAGGMSVAQLADVVRKTMPENDPGILSAEQAKQIATYMHGAFYSEIARDRIKPARIDLARLTVTQYRQSLADILGSFRNPVPWNEQRGLSGDYFNRTFRMEFQGTGVAQRVDANVDFDYAADSPWPGKVDHHLYSIQWRGSLIAPETGEYEFTITTGHAGRLYVNDLTKPIIDAWVKSGTATEFKGRIFLIAGRAYPIRLDYSKGDQGKVEKGKKPEEQPRVKSMIKLSWVRPQGTPEPIASRHLIPVQVPEQYICTAKFPPDDRSFGWERGTTVSREWDAATTEAALDAATFIGLKLNEFTAVKENDPKRSEKLQAFCTTFAERAFRRPLTSEQKSIIIDKQFNEAKSPELAVKRAVLMTLKSPFFLYREVQGGSDSHDTAARLSYALWDSVPDKILRDAAAKGELTTKDQVARQAERMLKDSRALAKLRGFLLTWLKLDQQHDLAKDMKAFPDFDAVTINDLRTSLELFLDDVIASQGTDYRQLLLSNEVFLNHRLARFYGGDVTPADGFRKIVLDADKRAGVLTHPYLMATFANGKESSPIHRGVFLARGVLGVSLRPPPEAVAPLSPELHPKLTTRERVAMQTNATACMTCHGIINPLGFTLEHFDAVGRLRKSDHDKPVDASGSYQTHNGATVKVNGARELAKFVAGSDEAHDAFAEQLFHHLVQQPVRAYGPTVSDDLRRSFVKNDFNIRKLAVEVLVTSALTPRAK